MRHTLKKHEILRGKKLFDEVFTRGKYIHGNILRCVWLSSSEIAQEDSPVLAGFVIRRTIRHAVDRNRVKRLIRESYRRHKEIIYSRIPSPTTTTLLVFLFPSSATSGFQLPKFIEVEQDVISILQRIALRIE